MAGNTVVITKEQLEIIEFTRKEFAKETVEDQFKMYGVLMVVACMKWPEHSENFLKAFKEAWNLDGNSNRANSP